MQKPSKHFAINLKMIFKTVNSKVFEDEIYIKIFLFFTNNVNLIHLLVTFGLRNYITSYKTSLNLKKSAKSVYLIVNSLKTDVFFHKGPFWKSC